MYLFLRYRSISGILANINHPSVSFYGDTSYNTTDQIYHDTECIIIPDLILSYFYNMSGTVAESVEHLHRVREIVGSNPRRVKPMTYKIDTCCFLAWRLGLVG